MIKQLFSRLGLRMGDPNKDSITTHGTNTTEEPGITDHQGVATGSHHYDDEGFLFLWNGTDFIGTNHTISRVRVDDTITVLPRDAFIRCFNLLEVQLPVGLTRVGDYCFHSCRSLKRISLPVSVEEIGSYAFSGSGLQEVKLPPRVTKIGSYAFSGSALQEVKIPPRVTKIEEAVFSGCRSLVRVELHDNVTLIGDGSFHGCSSLKNIDLPSSLQQICKSAFNACGLEQICLPENVSVGGKAFRDCTKLTKIFFPQSIGAIIQDNVFSTYFCPNLCAFHLPPPKEAKFTATEQKLITELCRTDGQNAMDLLGVGWREEEEARLASPFLFKKDPNSTVQTTCLFSFLKQNDFRIVKNKIQGEGIKRKIT